MFVPFLPGCFFFYFYVSEFIFAVISGMMYFSPPFCFFHFFFNVDSVHILSFFSYFCNIIYFPLSDRQFTFSFYFLHLDCCTYSPPLLMSLCFFPFIYFYFCSTFFYFFPVYESRFLFSIFSSWLPTLSTSKLKR